MKIVITGGNGDIAKSIAKKISTSYPDAEIHSPSRQVLNVLDYKKCSQYIEEIKPDILINNAGYIKVNYLGNNNISPDLDSININLSSIFNLSNAAIKHNRSCQIINIGSSAGTKSRGGWSAYCAAKAGLIMATKCWADEGIDTICLSPGRTISKMRNMLFPNEDQSTLLESEKFAEVVILAIQHKFSNGSNIDVNINNIEELLGE